MNAETITDIRASALDLTRAAALASTAATRLKLAHARAPLPAGVVATLEAVLADVLHLARLADSLFHVSEGQAVRG